MVLQASGPNALGIVRSLGRVGIPVIACDHDPHAVGLVSRYAAPHPRRTPDRPGALRRRPAGAGSRSPEGAVLFATHDEAIAALGPRQAEVEALPPPWTPWPAVDAIMDKEHQHEVARASGFPVPATVTPRDDGDIVAAARALRFPVVLKPRATPRSSATASAHLLEAADPEALRRAWELAAPYDPQVCEVIPGDDSHLWTYGSYRDATGRALAVFTGRKLRQWPVGFGAASGRGALGPRPGGPLRRPPGRARLPRPLAGRGEARPARRARPPHRGERAGPGSGSGWRPTAA